MGLAFSLIDGCAYLEDLARHPAREPTDPPQPDIPKPMDPRHIAWFEQRGKTVPRILFRGYHSLSGGGHEGLNSEAGVVPHEWLPQRGRPRWPLDIRAAPEDAFWDALDAHLHTDREPTPFSSWTPDLETALNFATRRASGSGAALRGAASHVAVLDTALFLPDPRARGRRVFHALALGARAPTWMQDEYDPLPACEYLVWGPARGPAYRTVPVERVRAALGCPAWPPCRARLVLSPHRPSKAEVVAAARVGRLFLGAGGAAATASDVVVGVTTAVAELARYQWDAPSPRGWREDPRYQALVLRWRARDVETVVAVLFAMIPEILRCQEDLLASGGLVNPLADTTGFPQLRLSYEVLRCITGALDAVSSGSRKGTMKEIQSVEEYQQLARECQNMPKQEHTWCNHKNTRASGRRSAAPRPEPRCDDGEGAKKQEAQRPLGGSESAPSLYRRRPDEMFKEPRIDRGRCSARAFIR